MRRTLIAMAVLGLGFLLGLQSPRTAHAETPAALRATLDRFVAAVNAADRAAIQAECTSALFGRIDPALTGDPAPGELGTFTVLQPTYLRQGMATGLVVCSQSDGVRDVLRLTLLVEGGDWKVAGGLGSITPARPLGGE